MPSYDTEASKYALFDIVDDLIQPDMYAFRGTTQMSLGISSTDITGIV